jgi:uncharacterized protein (DUF362 family)
MGNIVSLVRTEDSSQNVKTSIFTAVNMIGFRPQKTVKSVVIKPNLCYYWDASTGQTTDPKVVSGIIDYVRKECGASVDIKVAEADASAMRTKFAFPMLGYEKLAKEKNVQLLNLSSDPLVEETVRVNGRNIAFKVPTSLLNSDLFINVPKLKIMRDVKITCAMKNIFGCNGFPRKLIYHEFLSEAIVGINKILHPQLTIVDGLVVLGRVPARLGLIVAGTDTFSVDYVVSQIAGKDPSKIKFLRLAIKERLGGRHNISTIGESLREVAKAFPKERVGFVASKHLLDFQIWLLGAYCAVTGDIMPPALEEA